MLIETVSNYKYKNLGTLNSVSETDVVDTLYGMCDITWQHINNASATSPNIVLLGSIDGDNYFELDNSTATGGEMRHIINKPVRYIKVRVDNMGDATSINIIVFVKRMSIYI
jgi:hypothetical protein